MTICLENLEISVLVLVLARTGSIGLCVIQTISVRSGRVLQNAEKRNLLKHYILAAKAKSLNIGNVHKKVYNKTRKTAK